jgi:diguanylate cyclase (GGDEF)-like protein
MIDLIHTVAELVEGRDREDLETSLARVLFVLSGARKLVLWRVFHRADGVWLRQRAMLPALGPEDLQSAEDTPLGAAPEPLRLAYETRNFVRWRERSGDSSGAVLAVPGGSEVLALVVIETARELKRDQTAALSGIMRIYRNHLDALNFADFDELTRLANRRTFDEQFNRLASAEAKRRNAKRVDDVTGARAHLGVADIDFFKQVNDRFGHPYGDEVLVLFAGLMRQTFRDTDKLFRFGGEEFVILLSNCGVEDALVAFERFRAAVAAYRFPQLGHVTVSIGVTSVRADEAGMATFGRADQALYVAKRRGRNRVLLYEALPDDSTLETRLRPAPEVELF